MEKTSDKILAYISKHGQASGKELSDFLGITDRAVRKQLRVLLDAGRIGKIGKPPRVFYVHSEKRDHTKSLAVSLDKKQLSIFQTHFLYITSRGE